MKGGYKDGNAVEFYAFYDSNEFVTGELEIREETLPFDFGPVYGSRKMYHFDGGAIFLVCMNARQAYRMYSDSGPLVKIHFCLKGEKKTGIDAENLHFHVRQNENNLYHFVDCTGYFDFTPGQYIEYVDICLNDDLFAKITESYRIPFEKLLIAIANNSFEKIGSQSIKTTLRMKAVLNEVLSCHPNMHIKKAYFIHKLVELMLLQLDAAPDPKQETKGRMICKTPQDYQKLEQAKDILLADLICPPRLNALARKVGINDYKLKKGFKEVYKNTVMGYLSEHKLTLANEMIQSKQYTISEICDKLGYKSLSHFSRSFKKRFNINPSTV